MKSFIAIGNSLDDKKRWKIVALRSSIGSLPTEGTRFFFCPYDISIYSGPTAPPTTEPNMGRQPPAPGLEEGGGLVTASESSKSSDMLYSKASSSDTEEEHISASASDSRDSPSKLNIGVRNVKKVQNGGVAVECNTEEQLNKIVQEINSNPSLQGKVETKSPVRRDPKIIVYDVDGTVTKENFIHTFCQQNEVDATKISGTFSLKSKMKDKMHWVIQTDPKTFKAIMRTKKVYFEWARLSIREFLRPTKCYKCNRYGHISTKCQHEETCPRCGEEGHKRDTCTKEAKCINCSEAAKKFGRDIPANHEATSQSCLTHINELKALRQRTCYV
ncbi:hypothetical protein AVEN_275510-1 [Araneus ventricosus]|uniref:CCHC-type domain-containing protein n=1 Tax=Araneus ventricosus TaxID=182803 RepID=A0A4Y2QXJ7_ARAVE|nr:hypothetical protein AVEN_275510-1 [Araneus ventricosus]